MAPVRTLLFSTLYPSAARPLHGIFVETRLRELLKTGEVETRVVAPVPWFPSTHPRFGDWARMAATPARETRHGIDVIHPRYPLPPRVGMTIAPLSLALCSLPALRRLLAEGFDFDVIDAHYFYPDGVAAVLLAGWLGKPVTITARGSDLSHLPRHALPRRMMAWAARRSDACVGVCQALVDVLARWGTPAERLHVMRNGVDLERFRPEPQAMARRRLGLDGAPLILSVGNLVELKGHHLVIDALQCVRRRHPEARLVILGKGPERDALLARVQACKLGAAVQLPGTVPNEELRHWFSAADLTVLASSREGWANVLLESMACGTPVVATRIWGTPEVVAGPPAGLLIERRDAAALAAGIEALLAAPPQRAAVRRYAEGFSWSSTSQAQLALFGALRRRAAAPGAVHA